MRTILKSNRVFASWVITNSCNYRCSYCYNNCSAPVEKWDIDAIISTLSRTGQKWCMGITVESLSLSDFINICNQFVKNDITLYIDTNLSIEKGRNLQKQYLLQWWKIFISLFTLKNGKDAMK